MAICDERGWQKRHGVALEPVSLYAAGGITAGNGGPVTATIDIDGKQLTLGCASAEQLIDLRHAVLRDGLPREEAIFKGDADPQSRHYAAFYQGDPVCCTTLHPSTWESEPAWHLRGMATAPAFRGRGVGTALMKLLEEDLRASSVVRLLWCNARVPASRFYQKLGWVIRSDIFEIPTAGPHYRMTRRI